MKHLLVTNDFPPKIGGIQSLLWEWWRRLPPDSFAVLTSPYDGTAEFDAGEPYRIERTREPVLLPHPWMVNQVNDLAERVRCRPRGARSGGAARPDRPIARAAVPPRAPRRRGDRARAPAGRQAGARRTRCVAPRASSPQAATPPPRPCMRRAASCRSPWSRAASTPRSSFRSTPPSVWPHGSTSGSMPMPR